MDGSAEAIDIVAELRATTHEDDYEDVEALSHVISYSFVEASEANRHKAADVFDPKVCENGATREIRRG